MSSAVDERITDELEALEAILMDDVTIKSVDGVPHMIETVVHPSTGDDTDQQFVCVTLEVKLTPGYPDTSPEVYLRNPRGLDDEVLAVINSQIKEKLNDCLGQPVVFELIELIRENLTESNLPSGQCVICLYGFAEGDVFIKTQCYHHFHSHCLANHLISGRKYYDEELEKLPSWQQMQAPAYQQTCPVCRCPVSCDVDTLKKAPPPVDSITAPPFCLTAELKALQLKMAALLQQQIAKGGVVGVGDTGPPPLTITSPADNDNATNTSSSSQVGAKAAEVAIGHTRPSGNGSNDSSTPASPQRSAYRGPYRGFNRRGKPGRRGRGAAVAPR
ncbi:E3 ubiquitin-protein ligase RNF25 isoform X2 [Pectinophora gossypiella]|uniref:E3 ubiquitin-protein ligase RNF25 isoform X2 n=1 Tax=Pectinophora gossypiella TaxID=13191 RepID=UPI00214F0E21|nr:E3 ubiquitin-protein ligase RNF25 isoform X2 [Pectinophora gossypiella]